MADGTPLCLAGRLIGFGKETDRMLAGCWLMGGSVFFYCKIETKKHVFFSSWLTAWLAAPLFAQLVGGRLIGFGKETDRMLADCWLVGGSMFFLLQNSD